MAVFSFCFFFTGGVVIVGPKVISLRCFLLSHLKLEGRKLLKEKDSIVLVFLNILKEDQRNEAASVDPAACKNTKA